MLNADHARTLGGQSWRFIGASRPVGVVLTQSATLDLLAPGPGDAVAIDQLDQCDPRIGAWTSARADNPALHDGPVWSVSAVTPDASDSLRISLRPDRYWRVALGERAETDDPVRLMGVKGFIVGQDRQAHPHVLIARRAPWVRVYANQWEVCPAGGVDRGLRQPSAAIGATRSPTGDHHAIRGPLPAVILETLATELSEELGLDRAERLCDERVLAVALDDHACSLDVIVGATWRGVVDPRRGLCVSGSCGRGGAGESEYSDLAWVARDELPDFVRGHADAISAVTRAVWLALGWISESDALLDGR